MTKLDHDKALDRLRYIVAQTRIDTVTTRGGTVKAKTRKQREIDLRVAEEVVRFAFDHAGITNGHLAPGGLFMDLLNCTT